MSKNNIANDLVLVLNGLLKVARSGAVIHKSNVETILRNSNVRKVVENTPSLFINSVPSDFENTIQRASMIPVGISQFATVAPKYILPDRLTKRHESKNKSESTNFIPDEEILNIREEDLEGLYIQSLGVEILQQNADGKRYCEEEEKSNSNKNCGDEHQQKVGSLSKPSSISSSHTRGDDLMNALVEETSRVLQQDKTKSRAPMAPKFMQSSIVGNPLPSHFCNDDVQTLSSIPIQEEQLIPSITEVVAPTTARPTSEPIKMLIKPLSKKKPVSQLSETSKQRKVPSTRISRLVSYGGLAAGLGFGALAEVTKRSLGLANPSTDGSSLLDSNPFLTEANATRIVDTLCRVRGAALKIGQILSIQDNSMLNPELQKVFERVRHAADFMPDWQMERILVSELGIDWREKLLEFDIRPFAAASIGQVHLAKLPDGRPIAVKIQYPGVGEGISSDIDNLMAVLSVWKIIPDGVFIDSIITVAKRELSWEVDYIREAKCAKRFRKLLEPHPDYYVPDVVDALTTKLIYSTELIEGIPVDKCETLDQETRDRICFLMQEFVIDNQYATSNYNYIALQIGLLDFGSSREYNNSFVDKYMKILEGAANADIGKIIHYSRKIGFLSGHESKVMENAHTDAVLLLGEAFRIGEEPYDFGKQDITMRIQRLVPVMVKERLVPPPEEIYSLHRKLSGVFLLCNKLKGKVRCRQIFERVQKNYQFDRPDTESEI
ncbi:AarF domain-containing protein kinase 4 [Folsomia candida]|uniref:AarF domain-containing protein kinase 4 n=1 Tax=Folsomia candida TaxID=158441 RepID=A0A226EU04_FOLCA|nr:AarF domain-containing protein kinase 4 [Folsomia candida]